MTAQALLDLNPFPGLRPFTSGEADRFFGRQKQIDELVDLLGEARLVAVAGASGCGKSSLVLAGLTSELARRSAAGGEIEWRPVIARPGNHSIANLAQALAGALGMADDPARIDALYGRLSLGSLGLVDAIRAARLPPHVRVLVIIDQFEEIFRFRQADPEEPSAFVKLLLNAVQDPDTPIGVVLTLRSSELGNCADFPDLAEAVSRGQYLVPRLARDQRKEALVKPIEQAGFKIAPRLVQRVLNDVSDDFDDLPVMQHVMTRTWRRWAEASGGGRPVDVEDYEAVGTAAHALANHADEAYDSLPGLGPVVEKVLRALTERIGVGVENRRPLEFDRLCAITGADPADVARVIERFRRPDTAFLMPPPSVALSTNPIIDISHESLIRQWPRLRDWAKTEADSRTALLRVVEAARRYESDEGDLAQGRDLERTLAWRRSAQPTPAWAELYTAADGAGAWASAERFLEASAEAARRARRRRRLRTWTLRGTVIALLLFGWVFAVTVYGLRKEASSHALASSALLASNTASAAHLALAAIENDPDNPRAELALRQSLSALEDSRMTHFIRFGAPIEDAGYTADKSRLVVAGGTTVRVYDARDFKPMGNDITRPANVQRAWLLANNEWLVTLTSDKSAQVEKLGSGVSTPLACPLPEKISAFTVSADERSVAAGCSNGTLRVWNVGSWDTPATLSPGGAALTEVTALGFSADQSYLASGHRDGRLVVWQRGDAGAWLALQGESPARHKARIREIAFDPRAGGRLAAASDDRMAIIWTIDVPGRRIVEEKRFGHEGPITLMRFVPENAGASTLMTAASKEVYLWRDPQRLAMRPNNDTVRDANVSPDGLYLASANTDGNAALMSALTGMPLAVLHGHRNFVTRAFFMPSGPTKGDDGVYLMTASADGYLRGWRVHPPESIAGGHDHLLSAAFDSTGKRVAYCGRPGSEKAPCNIIDFASDQGGRRTALHADGSADARNVSWSPDGQWVLARRIGSGPSTPVLWDAQTGREETPAWLRKYANALFSRDAPRLLTVGADGALAVWDNTSVTADNRTPVATQAGHADLTRAAISPDGRWVATWGGGNHRHIWLWDTSRKDAAPRLLRSGRKDEADTSHTGRIEDVQFSRDSKRLVSASADQTARIWTVDAASGGRDLLAELADGHTSYVLSAAFSPDGKLVATGSADFGIGVWDATRGHLIAMLPPHADEANYVQFHPGRAAAILSASDDGTVKYTVCEPCTLPIAELKQRVARDARLTDEEQSKVDEIKAAVVKQVFRWPAFLSR